VTGEDLHKLAGLWLKIHSVEAGWLSRGYEKPLAQLELEFELEFKKYLEWAAAEFPPGKRAAQLCGQLLESRRTVFTELAQHQPVDCFCRANPALQTFCLTWTIAAGLTLVQPPGCTFTWLYTRSSVWY
jgi:hypothetical protein